MGITNAPQGGGSSGGGEWIEHSSTDWSDLISFSNYRFTFLKDVRFKVVDRTYNNAILWTDIEIPAGTTMGSMKIPLSQGYCGASTTGIEFGQYFELYSSNITSSDVRLILGRLSVSNGALTLSNVTINSWSKGYIKVYYKD